MNENQNSIKIIQTLPKLVEAVYIDGLLYFSGEVLLATEGRRSTLLNDINLVKEQIANLERTLS